MSAGLDLTDRLSVLGGVQLGIHTGAANADSPLFEDEVTASAFLGVSYSLFQSQRRVPSR